jgi:phosphate transport system permease protein
MESISLKRASPYLRRSAADKAASFLYLEAAILSSFSLVLIVVFILIKGLAPFFKTYTVTDNSAFQVNAWQFLTACSWYTLPSVSGVLFLVINTIYISLLACLLSVPLSVLTALFISKIAPRKLGKMMAFVIELLSAIPSVVYGLFGRGFVTVVIRDLATGLGIQSKGGLSTLAGALVLSFMIIPIITSISVNAMDMVPKEFLANSLALGASKPETYFKLLIPSASGGIFAGTILGMGRALGEATALSMVVGNAVNGPTFDLFGITSTLTTTMLLGYSEAVGVNAEIRFSIGLVLVVVIILMDLLLYSFKHLKEKHDGTL